MGKCCRICDEELTAIEVRTNDGICDDCEGDIDADDDDQSWGAHEND